jgi:hypothetical protein
VLNYPGSKKPVKTFTKSALSGAGVLEAPVQWELGEGKKMQANGKEYEFFTIGDLARLLNRKPVTIRKWEAEGVIPKAVYIMPSKIKDTRGIRRLYSRQQIEGLVVIAREEGVLEPNANGKWKSIEETDFRQRAYDLFVQLEEA